MSNRLLLRCFSIASIPLGLAAWVLLPPLFSLIIILSLAYVAEHCLAALEVRVDRVQQSVERQELNRFELAENTALVSPENIFIEDSSSCVRKVTT